MPPPQSQGSQGGTYTRWTWGAKASRRESLSVQVQAWTRDRGPVGYRSKQNHWALKAVGRVGAGTKRQVDPQRAEEQAPGFIM